jgi:hypothetical protein
MAEDREAGHITPFASRPAATETAGITLTTRISAN